SFPMKWVVTGVFVTAIALIVTQKLHLGLDLWMTTAAIVLSVPMMLVGLRVLGETNWGPISSLSNVMQVIFGALAPGHILANMVASGTTGTIAVESEALMQDYKAGHMIGSSPKNLTIMQLLATPIGAAAVSWTYPLLRDTYGIVGENAVLSVMFLGSLVERLWWRADRRSHELYMVPLASGFIAGEAIVAVIVPLLVVFGLVR